MADALPRRVFRVLYDDQGKPFVADRMLVARSGSWFTTQRRDGSLHKENGLRWSDTIVIAIQREAENMLWRFAMDVDRKGQIAAMDQLILEAIELGKIIGKLDTETPSCP